MEDRFKEAQLCLKATISKARSIVLTADIWTKKSLSASFLGISACFFNPIVNKAQHVLLNLHQMDHPHTGKAIAEKVNDTLKKWEIPKCKILLLVTDNGSNMKKAMRELNTSSETEIGASLLDEGVENEDEEREFEDDEEQSQTNHATDDDIERNEQEEANAIEELNTQGVRSLSCLAHTLQLIVKDGLKDTGVQSLLSQCRKIVKKIRKSSVGIQELIKLAKKTVVLDCPTRWNSTMLMIEKLLEVRVHLEAVFMHNNWDCLVASQWTRLDNLLVLLKPFALNTNVLQSDAMSLSNVVPAILDLECHLEEITQYKTVAQVMLQSLRRRCAKLIDPSCDDFEVIPAAACLADPTVAKCLIMPANSHRNRTQSLLQAARLYLVQCCQQGQRAQASQETANQTDHNESLAEADYSTQSKSNSTAGAAQPLEMPEIEINNSVPGNSKEPPLKKFKSLYNSMMIDGIQRQQVPVRVTFESELLKYERMLQEQDDNDDDSFQFWLIKSQSQLSPFLCKVAVDLCAAPASEAYCERIFSLCGDLCAGKRNRSTKSLELKAFLKLNHAVLCEHESHQDTKK